MIKSDCHFHTNFFFPLEFLVKKRAKDIWNKLEDEKMDIVILTEHVFKQPAKSWRKLMKYRPEGARTHLVPGVEAMTKEGADIIVFSKDDYVYTQKDVMTTKGLTLDEMVEKIENDDRLFAIVPHPYQVTSTGIVHYTDKEKRDDILLRFGYVEKYNSSAKPIQRGFEKYRLNKFMKDSYRSAQIIAEVPDELLPEGVTKMGGSDAHFPQDIGSHLQIDGEYSDNYDEMFEALVARDNKIGYAHKEKFLPVFIFSLKNGFCCSLEHFRKRLKMYKTDYIEKK